mgnify:CR=1 FL=1
MLPTQGPPPAGAGWIAEIKHDGARGLARVHDGQVLLQSRPGNNLTGRFPEVTAALSNLLPDRVILDGEIVTLDADRRPDFQRLQRRLTLNRPSTLQQRAIPARYLIFDILHLDGEDLNALPWTARRGVLEELLPAKSGIAVAPPVYRDLDPATLLEVADELGIEGVVAKRADSPYRPGRRTREWLKAPIRRRAELALLGYFPGRTLPVAALIVGGHDSTGQLRYCGTVSAGLGALISARLHTELAPLRTSTPPWRTAKADTAEDSGTKSAVWLRPGMAVTVDYRQFTGRLRHPSIKGVAPASDPGWLPLPSM